MTTFAYINKGKKDRPNQDRWDGAVIVAETLKDSELFGEYESRLEGKLRLAETDEDRTRVTANWWMRFLTGEPLTEWRGGPYGDSLDAEVIEDPSEEVLKEIRKANYGSAPAAERD